MTRISLLGQAGSAALLALAAGAPALAQWEHRYPKLEDFGHQVYLEQHELPILSGGPIDPAPSPDGASLAFAAQGWIWLMNLETRTARRLTDSAGVDARPRWSPSGDRLAFVRDSGADTAIVVLDMARNRETVIDSPAIDIDPEFSADGQWLYYASGASGSLSLVKRHLASGAEERFTDRRQVERNARRLPGGEGVVYLAGLGAYRELRVRDFLTGEDETVREETLTYHLTSDVHPERDLIVFSAPIDNAYHLWTMDLSQARVAHRLTEGAPYALTPAFSADGDHIYYAEADDQRRFQLMRIATYGGAPEVVEVSGWDYGARTGAMSLRLENGDGEPVAARLSIRRADGHPVANPEGATYFDPQTGRNYFYADGSVALNLPAGRYEILAARGPMTVLQRAEIRVRPGGEAETVLVLDPLWDAVSAGYSSADHHVHLNGDGHHRADHEDALAVIAGEDLDLLAPMSWNRWERRIDQPILWDVTESGHGHIIDQAQEVRSHFHGHVSLMGAETAFTPWFWGPRNPVLGDPDLSNGDVFDHADAEGGFVTYVHPIGGDADPFDDLAANPIPLELPADGVLEERMGLELVCAWTSPLGNAALWYRFLNIGRPVAAMSGTDAWVDFYRTPAMGTGRTYLRTGGEANDAASILEAAASGRSFVTTGPALVFALEDGSRPGDVTAPGPARWTATLASTVDVEIFEIVVNGEVVQRFDGVSAGQSRAYQGEITLPQGGWVTARAYAAEQRADSWPSMHARAFAHASPVWIGEIGSIEAEAAAEAATDLIAAINLAEMRARIAYGEDRAPLRMLERFEAARESLRVLGGAD